MSCNERYYLEAIEALELLGELEKAEKLRKEYLSKKYPVRRGDGEFEESCVENYDANVSGITHDSSSGGLMNKVAKLKNDFLTLFLEVT